MRIRNLLLVAVVLAWLGPNRSPVFAQPPIPKEKITNRDVQSTIQFWQYSGIDLPKGSVATITAAGQWHVNPGWGKKVGPGGNPEDIANDKYVKSGVPAGCLLIRAGKDVIAFSKDGDAVRITEPGKIYFCTNDERTVLGAARAQKLPNGLPIPAALDTDGEGFVDNAGSLKVRIAVISRKDELTHQLRKYQGLMEFQDREYKRILFELDAQAKLIETNLKTVNGAADVVKFVASSANGLRNLAAVAKKGQAAMFREFLDQALPTEFKDILVDVLSPSGLYDLYSKVTTGKNVLEEIRKTREHIVQARVDAATPFLHKIRDIQAEIDKLK